MAYYALPARRGRKKNFRRVKVGRRGVRWQITRRDVKKYGSRVGRPGRFIKQATARSYYKPRARKGATAATSPLILPVSYRVAANRPKRRKRRGRSHNPPILMLANRLRRRRKARRRPVLHRRRRRGGRNPRGYVAIGRLRRVKPKGRKSSRRYLLPRRRNPDGIVAQVQAVFTIDNAKLAGAGLGGLVATNTVTDQIGKLLGREYQFQGGEGVLASAVSTGIVTGGVSLIVKSPGILGAVAIGGLIATAIRAIRWLMPGQAEKLGVGHTGSSASRAMASGSTSASPGQNGLGMVQSVEQIAAGESHARGLGDFLELRGLGQIPSSAVEGMGDFLTTTSPSSEWGGGKDIVPGSGEQF